jgi:Na+/proline symporter
MYVFTGIFVVINIFFLSVGALLYLYAEKNGISIPIDALTGKPRTDLLFPEIAFNHLSLIPAIIFLLGLTAATFATTDSALTALTTSFCVDFLHMDKPTAPDNGTAVRTRHLVHIGFSLLLLGVIMVIYWLNSDSVVSLIFKIAAFTYGPLLGLYAFGLFVKTKTVKNNWVPLVCVLAPALTFFISVYAAEWFGNYQFAEELIIINGGLTFLGLLLISKPAKGNTRF